MHTRLQDVCAEVLDLVEWASDEKETIIFWPGEEGGIELHAATFAEGRNADCDYRTYSETAGRHVVIVGGLLFAQSLLSSMLSASFAGARSIGVISVRRFLTDDECIGFGSMANWVLIPDNLDDQRHRLPANVYPFPFLHERRQ